MGITDQLVRPSTRSEVSWHPLDERWFTEVAQFSETFSGFPIGPDTALRVGAVFACTSLIAETIASLPCILYQRQDDGGKRRAREHRLYRTLRWRPLRRRKLTAVDFFGGQQMHLGLRGAALAEIIDDGRTVELLPLLPGRTFIEETPSGGLRYRLRESGREPRTLVEDEVLHVRDLPVDGHTGVARAALAREAIAVAAAAEAYVGGFFKYDATGRLLIMHPGNLSPEKRNEFREMVQENFGGWKNRSKAMLLTHGVQAEELGTQEDSKHLVDPRNYQVADIARFWRVPLFMIGLEEKSTTWGTGVESQKQGFVDFTIKPWTDRWAQAMTISLLSEEELEQGYFIEFLFDDLVRGNLIDRMKSYQIARNIGVLSPDEIRQRENMGAREDGRGGEYQDTPPGTAPSGESAAVPGPLLQDVAARLAVKECRAIERRAEKADGDPGRWSAWLETYYAEHRAYARNVLAPIAEACGLDPWSPEKAAALIESSALEMLADGVPDNWEHRRREDIRRVIEEMMS